MSVAGVEGFRDDFFADVCWAIYSVPSQCLKEYSLTFDRPE